MFGESGGDLTTLTAHRARKLDFSLEFQEFSSFSDLGGEGEGDEGRRKNVKMMSRDSKTLEKHPKQCQEILESTQNEF